MARRRLITMITVVSILAGAAAWGSSRPPKNLKKVGNHWTAWNPPTSFPAGAKLYTIVPGDTLWDLSAKFLSDPYLWPQLWEHNRYILDAHWIYPGDPLVIAPKVEPVEKLGKKAPATGEKEAKAQEEAPEVAQPTEGPVPLGTESDIYCSGFIGKLKEKFGYKIIGSEYGNLSVEQSPDVQDSPPPLGATATVKYDLSSGDIVYLDGGKDGGLSPGEVFTAVDPGQVVRHPVTHKVVGRYYAYLGRVRVLSVQQKTAIAEISDSCRPLHVGAELKPFEQEPVPLARLGSMRPVNEPAAVSQIKSGATIIMSDDGVVSLGQDHIVYIDRGSEDNVTPGDLFTIYRLNKRGMPPVVIGELGVLSVQPHTAVAKIIRSRYPIFVGDRADPK